MERHLRYISRRLADPGSRRWRSRGRNDAWRNDAATETSSRNGTTRIGRGGWRCSGRLGGGYMSRRLRKVRRVVAARLDMADRWEEADRVRRFSSRELVTLARLEGML